MASAAVASTTPAVVTPAQPAKALTEAELTDIFRSRQAELQALVAKITELETEGAEYSLVIETLQEAYDDAPTRKCFRQIGGVLVERTVKDVLPELQNHLKTLKDIADTLMDTYKKKETAFGAWQRANNIVVKQR